MGGHIEPGLPSGGPPRTPSPFRGWLCACSHKYLYIYILSTRKFTLGESNSISGFKLEFCRVLMGAESWRGALPLVCAAHPRL
jgi:hypothetical protein